MLRGCAASELASAAGWRSLRSTASLVSFSDPVNARFTGYYHQCRTELGFPRYREHHLADLLRHPGEDTPASFPPNGVETTFDPSASPRALAWVRGQAERVLLVYGENDPYSVRMHRAGESAAAQSLKGSVPRKRP